MTFISDNLEEELQIAAMLFFDEESNVRIDTGGYELHLSMIFKWYQSDFSPSVTKIPDINVQYLTGIRKEKLQSMLDSWRSIKVSYQSYNWGFNASGSKTYKKQHQKGPK